MVTMSAATDHFTSFVDVLADGAGRPRRPPVRTWPPGCTCRGSTSTGSSRRSPVSRRAGSGAGSCSSARRTACVTTGRTILDVAVEAGYGSHEAFTRAFTKAYGVGPQPWRRRPTQIRIEAPSDVHFHPPGSLRLPAEHEGDSHGPAHHDGRAPRLADRRDGRAAPPGSPTSSSTSRSSSRRRRPTRPIRVAAVPARRPDGHVERRDGQPGVRLVRRGARVGRLAARTGWPSEGPTYLAQVRDVVEQGRLDDTFVDALCEPAEVFTYGGMIAHVLTFAAHRRTLVVLALDKHGVTELGWGDPMRWVAEPR